MSEMNSEKYPLIKSVLGGIYGSQTTKSDSEDISQLKKDLEHEPFKSGFTKELKLAFNDNEISWQVILEECDVMCVNTEQEAKYFAEKYLWEVTFE